MGFSRSTFRKLTQNYGVCGRVMSCEPKDRVCSRTLLLMVTNLTALASEQESWTRDSSLSIARAVTCKKQVTVSSQENQ